MYSIYDFNYFMGFIFSEEVINGLRSGDSFTLCNIEDPVSSTAVIRSVGASRLGFSSGHTSLLFFMNTPTAVRGDGTKSTFIDSFTDFVVGNFGNKANLVSIRIKVKG
jgi:hypothetical protein